MNVKPLGPVAGAYCLDNSRVAVIEGPVGSGKSTASCLRLARHAYEQTPGTDGIARTRWAIVRNTKPQLVDTTQKTWFEIFPEKDYGEFIKRDAIQTWSFMPQGHRYPIHAEFIFRALDDAADVSNLLSLEVTGFWFNECREIAEEIIAHAGRRCRYLNGDRPSKWSGWIGDTNPWDTEHFLQDRLVTNPREGWKHFIQPGGMEDNAENLENLEQTEETLALPFSHPRRREQGRSYYIKAVQDYSPEDARVYVHAQRGITKHGKPIYSDYRDGVHCKAFDLVPGLPLVLGLDFGRTPAAVIGQHTATGQWRARYELCSFDMGVKRFGEELKRFLTERCFGFEIGSVTGDPAGNAKDGSEQTAFDLLRASGIICKPAGTNELSVRIEAVQGNFRRMVDGQPGIIIHPDCKMLRRACIDGYHFRKLNVSGNRFAEDPDKNDWSHVAEALQYLLLGGGEARVVMNRKLNQNRPRFAQM
jgi:hypothetical protein